MHSNRSSPGRGTARLIALACALLAACGSSPAPEEALAQARSYARDDIACQTAADCCAVAYTCAAQVLLVSAADRQRVHDLIAEAPHTVCSACMWPPVQVDCRSGTCTMVALQPVENALVDWHAVEPFQQDHCGALPLPPGWQEAASASAAPRSTFTILGCGS